MTTKIRPAAFEDLPAIAEIHASSWKDAYRDMLPHDYLENDVRDDLVRHWRKARIQAEDVVLVAEEEQVIGFVAVWCRPDPLINNLHVLPNARSKGIGTRLLIAAAEQLLKHGQSVAFLWVLEDNRRAVQLYERLGGMRTERKVKPIFGHDLVSIRFVWADLSVLLRATERTIRDDVECGRKL